MKLYQTRNGYTLRTHDHRIYDIIGEKSNYLFRSETYVINGTLLHEIPNHIKRLCFRLNQKPQQ